MTIQKNINLYMFRAKFLAKKKKHFRRAVGFFPAKVWAGENDCFSILDHAYTTFQINTKEAIYIQGWFSLATES